MRPLGLIVGGGNLPRELAEAAAAVGRPVFAVRLEGFAADGFDQVPGAVHNIGEMGAAMAALRGAGCRELCFAGHVGRASFAGLRLDPRGRQALPRAMAAARHGDSALLACLIAEFEADGFELLGAHEVAPRLLLGADPLTRRALGAEDRLDIDRAMSVARVLGGLDVGQSAVSRDGQILAVEAQEGTDEMLRRAGALVSAAAGDGGGRRGVIAKVPKPGQDRRVDLPVIGPGTVRAAAAAGLAGIVGEPTGALLVERVEAVRLADELGLFIAGVVEEGGDAH